MRCASRVMLLFSTFFDVQEQTPSWYAGRYWLMRLGYYKIHRQKVQAKDWVWIVDYSIQIGQEKCFVILGIRLSALPVDRPLTFNDLEPIDVVPVTASNGSLVYKQLEEATKKTGIPRQIISDHGSDLKSGITTFTKHHNETCFIYDIKHKTAAVLKEHFEKDKRWAEFIAFCSQIKRRLQQTELAFAIPPGRRSKARYMNIDRFILWAIKALYFVDSHQKSPSEHLDNKKIEAQLYELLNFRQDIEQWREILLIAETTEHFVRTKGISHNNAINLEELLKAYSVCPQAQEIKEILLEFVINESKKAKENERLLGSSEIIESLFGKQKMLENEQSRSGFTGLILGIGAFLSSTTKEVVEHALTEVKTSTVIKWVQDKIGTTVQAYRKQYFNPINLEQIQNQTLGHEP